MSQVNSLSVFNFSKLSEKNVKLMVPSLKYCTDNAAMIATYGIFKFKANKYEKDLTFKPEIHPKPSYLQVNGDFFDRNERAQKEKEILLGSVPNEMVEPT